MVVNHDGTESTINEYTYEPALHIMVHFECQ